MAATILVVEDDPSIRELLAINLESSGHRVVEAASAEEAEPLITASLPDLILLDWMLPGRTGPQFAARLRESERTADVPIIMLTAMDQPVDRRRGIGFGADAYLTKPFDVDELTGTISILLEQKALLDEDALLP